MTSSAHGSCSLLPFLLALRLSVNSQVPYRILFILLLSHHQHFHYYIIIQFSSYATWGSHLAVRIRCFPKRHHHIGEVHVLLFSNSTVTPDPSMHPFHRTCRVYSALHWCGGCLFAYQCFGAFLFHPRQIYFIPLTLCTIYL